MTLTTLVARPNHEKKQVRGEFFGAVELAENWVSFLKILLSF